MEEGDGAGGGGGGGPGVGTPWYAGLAPEGTELPQLVTEAPDFATFVKTAEDLKAYQGQSLRIPGPEAPPEQVAEFHQKLTERVPGLYHMPAEDDIEGRVAIARKLGAPEAPEGYEFNVPESGDLDPTLTSQFRQWSNELNLTKAQAAGLYDKWNDYTRQAIGSIRGEQQEGLNQVKAEWGITYPDRVKKVDFLVSQYEGTEKLRQSLMNDEVPGPILRMLHGMAEGLLGEGMEMLNQPLAPEGLPPQEAAQRAAEVRASEAFNNAQHPQHADAVRQHVEYMKMANPSSDQDQPARAGFRSG